MIAFFSLSIYIPVILDDEEWNGYKVYANQYKWLSYSIFVTTVYNSKINNIDFNDFLALIQSESNGDVYAISSSSARGLSQIMPVHRKHAPEELYDIYLNIKLGSAYYAWCLRYTNYDKREALRIYNSGPFSNKYVYRNYEKYCDVIINNSNNTKNLVIPRIVVK